MSLNDQREKAALDLKIARADAIQSYASFEQSLCRLFAKLLNTSDDLAGIIFYRIIASRQRNAILEELLDRNFKTQFDTFWYGTPGSGSTKRQPGLFALIQQIDTERNFIVHWTARVEIGFGRVTEALIPPNYWNREDKREITVEMLVSFSAKADFIARAINIFTLYNLHEGAKGLMTEISWPEIFQQPCSYPPADSHPLSPNYVKR